MKLLCAIGVVLWILTTIGIVFFNRSAKETPMAKYSKKAERTIASAMKRKKKGTLTSGRSGKKVTSRKQAIAIGISEARQKGQKVPSKKSAKGRGATKRAKKSSTRTRSRKSS